MDHQNLRLAVVRCEVKQSALSFQDETCLSVLPLLSKDVYFQKLLHSLPKILLHSHRYQTSVFCDVQKHAGQKCETHKFS